MASARMGGADDAGTLQEPGYDPVDGLNEFVGGEVHAEMINRFQ